MSENHNEAARYTERIDSYAPEKTDAEWRASEKKARDARDDYKKSPEYTNAKKNFSNYDFDLQNLKNQETAKKSDKDKAWNDQDRAYTKATILDGLSKNAGGDDGKRGERLKAYEALNKAKQRLESASTTKTAKESAYNTSKNELDSLDQQAKKLAQKLDPSKEAILRGELTNIINQIQTADPSKASSIIKEQIKKQEELDKFIKEQGQVKAELAGLAGPLEEAGLAEQKFKGELEKAQEEVQKAQNILDGKTEDGSGWFTETLEQKHERLKQEAEAAWEAKETAWREWETLDKAFKTAEGSYNTAHMNVKDFEGKREAIKLANTQVTEKLQALERNLASIVAINEQIENDIKNLQAARKKDSNNVS